jgi:alpha-D-ribose 1-methylphosphonate 5-triphosphate diphosphatase
MAEELVLTNARVILADKVIDGHVVFRHGLIAEIGSGPARGEDLEGDYLLPGLVELHTDHLEGHYAPRPGVRWNPLASVQAHDAQVASSGITTVFDALRVGLNDDSGIYPEDFRKLGAAIHEGMQSGRLRAEHFIHLRCEVAAPDCLETFKPFEGDALVKLASLMDHSPGQRQFASVEAYRNYYQKKKRMSDAEFETFAERRTRESAQYALPHRNAISSLCNEAGIVLASHDDATVEQVADAQSRGIRIAEFPTSLDAAKASREGGMSILMGAPNVVRGGSHSGNVSARELASEGLLDILSSDYVPFSLMQAVFALGEGEEGIDLPSAVAIVTSKPAAAVGFTDRGEIAEGKRADLVRVNADAGVPVVRTVWRQGKRVI